jgi:DNA-binding NarL/FixJ family response regulator
MRVLLADDHQAFRDCLRRLLELRDIEVVGEAQNGREAVELASRLRPDLILMDVDMPVMTGLAATRLIQAELPDVKVVILTGSEDCANVVEAVASGARGYLRKGLPLGQLFERLDRVARGEQLLPARASAAPFDVFQRHNDQHTPHAERLAEALKAGLALPGLGGA